MGFSVYFASILTVLASMAAQAQLAPSAQSPSGQNSSAQSISQYLSMLDDDSPYRDIVLSAASDEVRKLVLDTPNFSKFSQWLKFEKFQVNILANLKDNSALGVAFIPDEGESLILFRRDGKIFRLFSMKSLNAGDKLHIDSIVVSPNGRWAALLIAENGQNTNFRLIVYDLATNQMVVRLSSYLIAGGPTWNASGQLGVWWHSQKSTKQTYAVFVPEEAFDYNVPVLTLKELDSSIFDWSSFRAQTPEYFRADSPVVSEGWARSEDGTMINYRLIHLPNALQDGSHPTFIYSYGGFGHSFNPYRPTSFPFYIPPDFLKRGGILVLPSLRGGNEGGPNWHKQAMGADKKMKTYQDLIAVAKDLVRNKWTSPQKIISVGGSNGGLTVAASALLAPGTFGLVIPCSGVLDPVMFPLFDPLSGIGWADDYGNPVTQADLIRRFSPVELAPNLSTTKFFIVTGDNDDRVNYTHSIKFFVAAALYRQNADDVLLYVGRRAGHSSVLVPDQFDQDDIAGAAVIWTRIYNYLGWQVTEKVEKKNGFSFF